MDRVIQLQKQSKVYYNEFDPFAAQWLRNLIQAGHIAPGDVDDRSIEDVKPSDLIGYTQCHFFAGIGGWSLALRLAGWDDSRPVWTGSCPCQPFSTAGAGKGKEDERHLYPIWDGLIAECKPPVIFGEQVASAITKGWLDDVYQGLEQKGYAIGSAVLPASSVGTPHRRERLWFVADLPEQRLPHWGRASLVRSETQSESERRSGDGFVADAECQRQQGSGTMGEPLHPETGNTREADRSDDVSSGFWDSHVWHICGDGKARPIEPSIPLLAHGVFGRVGQLRAYGNAIVPQVAAEFIVAFMECRP